MQNAFFTATVGRREDCIIKRFVAPGLHAFEQLVSNDPEVLIYEYNSTIARLSGNFSTKLPSRTLKRQRTLSQFRREKICLARRAMHLRGIAKPQEIRYNSKIKPYAKGRGPMTSGTGNTTNSSRRARLAAEMAARFECALQFVPREQMQRVEKSRRESRR